MNKLKRVFINILRLCRFQTQVHRAPENILRGGHFKTFYITLESWDLCMIIDNRFSIDFNDS